MADEGIAKLFATRSIEEIRQIEKSTRNDIEKKKEDLRQMVGERYRDLIEAADTISEMNQCSQNVREYSIDLQSFCAKDLMHDVSSVRTSNDYFKEGYMQIASQIKVLMELSESIWSTIEEGHLIKASCLYLEGHDILRNLNLDGSTKFSTVLQWFPVLSQQIQTLDSLRTTILEKCRLQLKDNDLDIWLITEAILAIVMLEKNSLKEVFEQFLQLRLEAIDDVFNNGETSLDTPTKLKLTRVLNIFLDTITHAYQLFVISSDHSHNAKDKQVNGIISTVLNLLQSNNFNDEIMSKLKLNDFLKERKGWRRYLPTTVVSCMDSFKSIASSENKIDNNEEHFFQPCKNWLSESKNKISSGTKNLLVYVTSFKDLSSLREVISVVLNLHVDDTLQEADIDSNEENLWLVMTKNLFNETINVWNLLFFDIFLHKCKELTNQVFKELIEKSKELISTSINSLMSAYQSDISTNANTFIWLEECGDVLPYTVWHQLTLNKSNDKISGLGIKTLAVTPSLSETYNKLNLEMSQILADLSCYVDLNLPQYNSGSNKTFYIEENEFKEICTQFQDACEKSIVKIFKVVNEIHANEKSKIDVHEKFENNDVSLYLSKLCQNYCKLCNVFKDGCSLGEDMYSRSRQFVSKNNPTESNKIDRWKNISESLSNQSKVLLKEWSNNVLVKFVNQFNRKLLMLPSCSEILTVLPVWESVLIEEETESGEKVCSTIKIPTNVSTHLIELFNNLCNKINTVGGHSLGRESLFDISSTLLTLILQSYKNLLNKNIDIKKPAQAWSLQMLFDLRMANSLLYTTTTDFSKVDASLSQGEPHHVTKDTYLEVIDWLESFIDPFDLDVFSPYLSKNLQLCNQRLGVLFGLVSPPGKSEVLYTTTSRPSQSGTSMHNTLALSPDCGRFSYLPVSSRISKNDMNVLPQSIKDQLPLSSAFNQITESDKKMSHNKITSSLYSKLGALSTSWLSMATADN